MRAADEKIAQLQQIAVAPQTHLHDFERQSQALLAQYVAKMEQVIAEAQARMQQILLPQSSTATPPATFQNLAPRPSHHEPQRTRLEKPVDDMDECGRRRLEHMLRAGYNPAVDALAFAKREELQALDRLARWQTEQGLPLTFERMPPEVDREQLAAFGAILARWRYHAHRPRGKWKFVRWIHAGWELDAQSEVELLRQVYARIDSSLRIPSPKL